MESPNHHENGHSPAGNRRAKVLLVEDHPVVRHGLASLINDEEDLVVCGESASVAETMPLVRKLKPDVVVIDLTLGDGDGLDLIKQIHESDPKLPLLVLSMHDEAVYAERALRAGALGYVMKKEATDRMMTGIRRVLAGELCVSERMAARMVKKLVNPDAEKSSDSPVEQLSEREFEVFRLIAQGVGPSEMARRLSVSVKTVETHRERIKEKLGLKSRAELTRFSLQWAMQHA
jgi:DNA-binding NarL/FixJ family response regulator